jgi:hypothetical protein
MSQGKHGVDWMRYCLTVLALSLGVSDASAQIFRGARGEPPVAVTAGIGFLYYAETIFDCSTGSVWDFGTALQYRGSVELRIGGQATVGLTAAHAKVPMRYLVTSGGASTCGGPLVNSCDATSDYTSVYATFSSGGSYGLHQILQIGLGISFFDNFREDDTGASLAPFSGDKDFSMTVGYGFGYGVSNRLSFALIQDAGLIMHQRTGLSGNSDTFHQHLVTRLQGRFAFGR